MFVTNYNPSSQGGIKASVVMKTALNILYLLLFFHLDGLKKSSEYVWS